MNTAINISTFGFLLSAFWCALPAGAFPPAPYHTLYGMVRNEMGDPIMDTNAVVTLETASGVQIKTTVVPSLSAAMNYRLPVPMDAGLTSDAYRPTALQPYVSFRMKVVIGTTTYLPMELHGNYANLGKPAQSTHLDLTLGVDTDNDGLPDGWEYATLAALGWDMDLSLISPHGRAFPGGMTFYQSYVSGTYAFDPADGFRLNTAGMATNGNPVLEFTAITGRTYSLLASTNMTAWFPVPFRNTADGPDAPSQGSYVASGVRLMRVEAVVPQVTGGGYLFKAQVQ